MSGEEGEAGAAELSELDELLQEAADPLAPERALALMEEVVACPGGLALLVERYAGVDSPVLLRPLTFLLARHASRQDMGSLLDLLLSLLRRLGTDDDWTRINLLSAVQLLSMYEQLASEEGVPLLYNFLLSCLDRSVSVQAAAIPALVAAYMEGALGVLSPDDLTDLRRRLGELQGTSDELLRMELSSLPALLAP